MSFRLLFLAGILALLVGSSPASADWVTLRDGQHLRGLDLKPAADGYRFTLENGDIISIAAEDFYYLERSPRGERLEFRGRSVSLREKILILQKEKKARERELLADCTSDGQEGHRTDIVDHKRFPRQLVRPEPFDVDRRIQDFAGRVHHGHRA